MLAIPTALLPLFLLTPVCGAANLQGDWVFPRNPDYSTVLQLGREYKIQWTSALQSWFPDYCPDCKPDSVDLWVTDSTSHQQHKIASGVNVTSALPMAWTATMSPTEISHYPTWVLRFLPSGKDLSSAHQEISSPIFVITDQDAASSSSSLVSLPPTSSTTPASSSPTMRSSAATDTETMTTPPSETITTLPSEMITTPPSSSELSTGARAGIGIGVGVGAIVLFTLGWFSARHYRSEDHTPTPGAAETQDRGAGGFGHGLQASTPRDPRHGIAGSLSECAATNIFTAPFRSGAVTCTYRLGICS
ncbi:hypothetical protein NUW58_g3999 [Xylaria curta]|uniref:Uncharacterized protein n=1 Tax=Xylaria curta TaxID=42375 RepID=A0ACC1PB35_9PEZI|nr:hypothetical protein NUW58_g3999 [Xylaria curta]